MMMLKSSTVVSWANNSQTPSFSTTLKLQTKIQSSSSSSSSSSMRSPLQFFATSPHFANFTKRHYSTSKTLAPPIVYISGEEMSRYAGELYLESWIKPHLDISKWEFYDLSCKSRDDTEDQVLHDAIRAGKRIGSIYKEPTITPTETQKVEMGLKKAWGSPNGAMRKGWNGITISRDTIHLKGMQLGYKNPVLFDRHAVGGEYGAGYKMVGKGKAVALFTPDDGSPPVIVDHRVLPDDCSALVVYSNPLDNVVEMAHIFLSRCLEARVLPCVVTKKTVFKWQEGFWERMKLVYDNFYKDKFVELGLYNPKNNGELTHFLSDVATMQLIRWSEGGFGMCSHNYDGDVLTDQISQIHRSPGFLSSVLNGVNDDGTMIKEFEASHGTVTDMWLAHLRGEETSLNPLGMMEALLGAIEHSAKLQSQKGVLEYRFNDIMFFTSQLRSAIHSQLTSDRPTRDLNPNGITTEQFVTEVAARLVDLLQSAPKPEPREANTPKLFDGEDAEDDLVAKLFQELDSNSNGTLSINEFKVALKKLGVSPRTKLRPF